jgi:hypothetical protein
LSRLLAGAALFYAVLRKSLPALLHLLTTALFSFVTLNLFQGLSLFSTTDAETSSA